MENHQLDLGKLPTGGELFIGLVGAVGVNMSTVRSHLSDSLKRLKYTVCEIKLSDWLTEQSLKSYSSDFFRLKELMKSGSEARAKSDRGDVLALSAIAKIWEIREESSISLEKNSKGKRKKLSSSVEETPKLYEQMKWPEVRPFTCYVFNQLKHPDEVRTLRWIYGQSFYLMGVYSPTENRKSNLVERIQNTSDTGTIDDWQVQADELMRTDYAENRADDFGQSVQKTFPLADVFVNESSNTLIDDIDRFVKLIFSNPFYTPSKDEQGMCIARTAADRSADLARQIGAAITTPDGEIVAIGCNEAAKPGGGQYWTGDSPDRRDFQLGFDSNDKAKQLILSDILRKIHAVTKTKVKWDIDDLVTGALSQRNDLANARIMDVIEYFRSVHAEMAALIDAARRGIAVKGATMYATTFPCHECAKHIVAAGIPRVVYVEPYPKSKASELFDDAISVDGVNFSKNKTRFEAFVGIAPRAFEDLFELGRIKRKDAAGKKINWTFQKARLRKSELEVAYWLKEVYYLKLFRAKTASVAVPKPPTSAISKSRIKNKSMKINVPHKHTARKFKK